jgi:RNA polymerase primary sigma factor
MIHWTSFHVIRAELQSMMRSEYDGSLSIYLARIARFPALTRENEAMLAQAIRQGTRQARNELVQSNLGFVVSVAKGYRNLGLPFEDLLHEGNLGLIEAAQRFDERRGVKFITYAMWWIRRSILLALKVQPGVIRMPESRMRNRRHVHEASHALRQELRREPEPAEIDRRLGRRWGTGSPLHRAQREIGLEEPAGTRLLDRLAAQDPTAEDRAIDEQLLSRLHEELKRLAPRAQRIVTLRFGLDGCGARTLLEVAALEGISRERARQVESEVLLRLRRVLSRRFPRPAAPLCLVAAAPDPA